MCGIVEKEVGEFVREGESGDKMMIFVSVGNPLLMLAK